MNTKKIDWVKKLCSRKFILAFGAFIGELLIAFGVAQDTITQIVAIVTAGLTIIAYIFSEGKIDAAAVAQTVTHVFEYPDEDEDEYPEDEETGE